VDVRVVRAGHVGAIGAEWVRTALAASSRAGRAAPTLMPALGSTALPVYAALSSARARGELDTSPLRLIQLDEYHPIRADDPRSLIGWLRRDVAGPLGIPEERILALDGGAADPSEACRAYDAAVAAAGGVDVAVLGLGPNGHVGFNEPTSDADAPTRRVDLSPASLASNARYWPDQDVPRGAVTAGMSTILGARQILLLVSGATKRRILLETLTRPVGPELPATYLRTHPRVTLVADHAAWPLDDPGAG